MDGQSLDSPDGLLVLYHKPLGEVCSHNRAEGPTVYDSLPDRWLQRKPPLTSIGRLDKDTSGLLLLTDQGPLVHRLTSPKTLCEKTYRVTVDRDLDPGLAAVFACGDLLLRSETTPCRPAKLDLSGPRTATITLTEGRYHQVRRMFASQGYHVETLHRIRFGPYELGELDVGTWKVLPL